MDNRLEIEISHLAGEVLEYAASPRAEVRKELLDTLCSKLKAGSTFIYKSLPGGPRSYFKYLGEGMLEEVRLPGATQLGTAPFIRVLPLMEFTRATEGGTLPLTPFAMPLLTVLELFKIGVEVCHPQLYLERVKLVAMEGSRHNG
jgi:hypothetical protein